MVVTQNARDLRRVKVLLAISLARTATLYVAFENLGNIIGALFVSKFRVRIPINPAHV